MQTLRHYFISDNLDDLEVLEEELEEAGVTTPQIHVLSNDDTGLANHRHLHEVLSFMKKDLIRSLMIGAVVGVVLSSLIIVAAWFFGLPEKTVGWVPFIFLAIIALGFSTWEGGLFGIQVPNTQFQRFEQALNEDKHVFFVDLDPDQEPILERALRDHPTLTMESTEIGTPHWMFALRNRFYRFVNRNLMSYSQIEQR